METVALLIHLSLLLDTASQMDTSSSHPDLQFYPQSKSWIGALKQCRSNRSDLVVITNDKMWQEVNLLLQEKEDITKGVWIGLERPIFGIEPQWTWVSGKKVEESVIQRNSSVDPLNHHCGKIIQVEKSFKWVDANCHAVLPFICQFFKPALSSTYQP